MSRDVMTAEARALHAVLSDDLDDAARILGGFLPVELRALQRACGLLGALCVNVRRDPPPTATAPGPVTPSQHASHLHPPTDESGVAGPGAADAARTLQTPISPLPTSEGGVDVAPPELGEDSSN